MTKPRPFRFYKYSQSFKSFSESSDFSRPRPKVVDGYFTNRKERIWFEKFLQKWGVRNGFDERGDCWYFHKENTAVFDIVVMLIQDEKMRKSAMEQFKKPTAKSTKRGLKNIFKTCKSLT